MTKYEALNLADLAKCYAEAAAQAAVLRRQAALTVDRTKLLRRADVCEKQAQRLWAKIEQSTRENPWSLLNWQLFGERPFNREDRGSRRLNG